MLSPTAWRHAQLACHKPYLLPTNAELFDLLPNTRTIAPGKHYNAEFLNGVLLNGLLETSASSQMNARTYLRVKVGCIDSLLL